MDKLHTTSTLFQASISRPLRRSSWFMIFIVFVLFMFFSSIKRQEDILDKAAQELAHLEQTKKNLLAQQEELSLQIENQSDPAWVEMVLKRNLGLVPKNQVKVYFYHNP